MLDTEKKFQIDYVFPYVDPNDKIWERNYYYFSSEGCNKNVKETARFRDFSLIKYIFRSIDEYASFIGNVFLIVASKSQKDRMEWLELSYPRLKVITHDQFIPEEYLPTFNSNTIEMFLPFLPDLSEHFIYGNDDIIFLNKTEWTDFFNLNGTLKLAYNYSKNTRPFNFSFCCRSTWQAVENLFHRSTRIDNMAYSYIKQFHGAASPRLLSDCKECFKKLESTILPSLTQFRNCSVNLNQYLFGYYSMFKNHYTKINNNYIGNYLSFDNDSLGGILDSLENSTSKMVCINDTAKMTRKDYDSINQELEIIFPKKSHFEKS